MANYCVVFKVLLLKSMVCSAGSNNETLIIRDVNSFVQFSDGTSLSNCDNDSMPLQVATDRLAEVYTVLCLSFSVTFTVHFSVC